jgi:hypothetical protein
MMDADIQDTTQTIPVDSLLNEDLFYVNFRIKKNLGLDHLALKADAEIYIQKMDDNN